MELVTIVEVKSVKHCVFPLMEERGGQMERKKEEGRHLTRKQKRRAEEEGGQRERVTVGITIKE